MKLIGGTDYVINNIMEEINDDYPDMFFNDIKIPIKIIRLKNQTLSYGKYEIYWTNDDSDLNKKISLKGYEFLGNSDRHPENIDNFCQRTSQYYNPELGHYKYMCYPYKKVYFINPEKSTILNSIFDNDIQTDITDLPEIEDNNPYEYNYYITMFGRRMNYFNMFVSLNIWKYKIENSLIKLLSSLQTKYNLSHMYKYGLFKTGDFIILTSGIYSNTQNSIKIQFVINEIYIFWVVNKLVKNIDKLHELGIYEFKFMYNYGKLKFASTLFEMFPGNDLISDSKKLYMEEITNDNVEKYTYLDKEYRREYLQPPNVVLYLNSDIDIKKLIDFLVELFPNSSDLNGKIITIPDKIPRFNIRINDIVCFSVDGHNQDKNKNLEGFIDENIPKEYKQIIDLATNYNLSRDQCNLLNNYSTYLTGHHLLDFVDGRCIVNNILSYKGIIGNKGSFYNVFKELNLLEYYIPIPMIFPNEDENSVSIIPGGKKKVRMSIIQKKKTTKKKSKIIKK
jgi:hypothetical protein